MIERLKYCINIFFILLKITNLESL